MTICSFATVSVSNAASYCFADNGPSVIAYARLWFTFPYSFLTIPVATAMFTELSDMQADGNTRGVIRGIVSGVIAYARLWFTFPYSFLTIPVATAMFTELSDMQADGNTRGVIRGIVSGSNQIFFLMIPFALYLIVFSVPLVTLYHMGAFTDDSITQIASYLAVMAVALPFYGVNTYLQMVFSSIRKMGVFSVVTLVASLAQIGIIACAAWGVQNNLPATIELIAAGTIASYLIGDVLLLGYLRKHFGKMGLGSTLLSCPPQLPARIRARSRGSCSRRSRAMGPRKLRRPSFGLDSASFRLHRRRRHREPSHHVRARR